jgi:glycosyltransferase involved in cell wall biosynthesis
VRFVYVGTLSRYRKLEHILMAAYLLSQRTTDFEVTLVGPDDTDGYHHRLVQHMTIADRVTIKPPIPYTDIPELLAAADVALAYVPPRPDWKLQPTLKVLEYRAIGVPIIASDNAPNREVVESELNGLLVGDSEMELAAAMERFVVDREFLESCCNHARAMRQGRSWTDVARSYENAFFSKMLTPRRRLL